MHFTLELETPGAALPRPTRSWIAHGELAEGNDIALQPGTSQLLLKLHI